VGKPVIFFTAPVVVINVYRVVLYSGGQMMSRGVYRKVAKILREHEASGHMIQDFSNMFKGDNPRFNKYRFFNACQGVQEVRCRSCGTRVDIDNTTHYCLELGVGSQPRRIGNEEDGDY
jgi:hypothetical protein